MIEFAVGFFIGGVLCDTIGDFLSVTEWFNATPPFITFSR